MNGWTRFDASERESVLSEVDRSKDVFYLILEMLKFKKDDETLVAQCVLQNTRVRFRSYMVRVSHLNSGVIKIVLG